MTDEKQPIGVIGVGWVGLVTAVCFAELGHRVTARDIVADKVEALGRGEVTIHEPGLAELLKRNRERLRFTTEMPAVLEQAQLLFVCVDTPPTASGDADLSRVRSVIEDLPTEGDQVLVMKSTVPVGTGRAIMRDLDAVPYVSCPEFLREGSAVEDFLHPDRVVIGNEPEDRDAGDAVASLFEPLGAPVIRTDVSSAEMVKLASNAFLATKISFINEIANVCEEVGADVAEVARGMGLDDRIGPRFLQPGIGYGGSCFSGRETLLVRYRGWSRLTTFAALWDLLDHEGAVVEGEAIAPAGLKVWSWVPGEERPEWMPVSVLTRRHYSGEMVRLRTKMGRGVTLTPDHPVLVGDGQDGKILTHMSAAEVTSECWLPLALGAGPGEEPARYSLSGGIEDGEIGVEEVIVRPEQREISALATLPVPKRRTILAHPRGHTQRISDIKRSGALRLHEAARAGMDLSGASVGTARNGTYVPLNLELDRRFWRVLGLYLAEGCVTSDLGRNQSRRERINWYFHPKHEEHLVEEVVDYWQSQGVKVSVFDATTARRVCVSSRILASWWTRTLGLGRDGYEQRIPNLVWEQSPERKKALLSGIWEGDGSWSLVGGGPSVTLDWGTVSDELADGVARLLGDLAIVCRWQRGKNARSTKETHWLRVSGADQIERALFLVPERDRTGVLSAIAGQKKRIAPTGYRRFDGSSAWLRVVETTREQWDGPVYSLKVPGSQTVVTGGGLVLSQCFPKDVSALKQLAGNSGYHFQLLNAVIEVNELQKRRVIKKLERHLGSLVGKRIALLGLAFKPDTDDMREASSLVLAARLQGEGAEVVGYDPVATEAAGKMLPGVQIANSAFDALDGVDAAVLVTEWPEFAELDWTDAARRMAKPLLIDGRNFLDPERLHAAGFEYDAIGRAVESGATESAS